jgi:hypothetical protein
MWRTRAGERSGGKAPGAGAAGTVAAGTVAPAAAARRCAACTHFRNDDGYLEAVFVGLTSLSSARGSTRADDGICLRHDRYLSARATCADFSPGRAAG